MSIVKITPLVLALVLGSCASTSTPPSHRSTTPSSTVATEAMDKTATAAISRDKVTVSNLVDNTSQQEVATALTSAGIPQANVDRFLERVREYNTVVPTDTLVNSGFSPFDLDHSYDLAAMSQAWSNVYPLYPGTNCRINTFLLGENTIAMPIAPTTQPTDPSQLFIDEDAINHSPTPLFTDAEHHAFHIVYSRIPTTSSKNTDQHLNDIKAFIADHNITFTNPNVHLVNVFIHDTLDTPAHLFIGHSGVAVPYNDRVLFVEKLAFDQPYQALTFSSMEELGGYLTAMYDDGPDQEYGHPVIMDNGELIAGYHVKQ